MRSCRGARALAAVLLLAPLAALAADAPPKETKILAPSGDVTLAPTASALQRVNASAPAPGPAGAQPLVDCLTEANTFYGSDFLSTKQVNASTPADCCAQCKAAEDCTVWNWCGAEGGCALPANLAGASGRDSVPYKNCVWKPRPVSYSGTLPLPPVTNSSGAMKGWTSGIPVNGSLVPDLPGFDRILGEELEYDPETDFYCAGSSTSKPVCQLYGSAKGGALACLNNPTCRGFQICWGFPAAPVGYAPTGTIRMKAGAQSPLNTSAALQNPYCTIYVARAGAAAAPSDGSGGYSLTAARNISAIAGAAQSVLATSAGRRLRQAASGVSLNGPGLRGDGQPVILLGPATQPQPGANNTGAAPAPASALAASRAGQNFTSELLAGAQLQAFPNRTFAYTQCYANAPTIKVTLQRQQFPLQGPTLSYSIHAWTERPFHSSATACCAFQASRDAFLSLETGILAAAQPLFAATNLNLTTGPALRNYDTSPVSVVQSLAYIPDMNSPAGNARQWAFPRLNGSAYTAALEQLHFSVAQTALGNLHCSAGKPELAGAVNFLTALLGEEAGGGGESPGGIPTDLQLLPAGPLADNTSCLLERGALYDEGDVLRTLGGDNATAESCCRACWAYADPADRQAQCDVWVLNAADGSCELRNSSAARAFEPLPTLRGGEWAAYTSGRRTAVLPSNATNYFVSTSP